MQSSPHFIEYVTQQPYWRVKLSNIKSSIKRAAQSEERRKHNMSFRTKLRTYIKRIRNATTKADAQAAYKEAQPIIDATANKGIIPKKKASRLNSRLSAFVKKFAS